MFDHIIDNPVPISLGFALDQNMIAINRFSALTEKERMALIRHTHGIEARDATRVFVDQISEGRI